MKRREQTGGAGQSPAFREYMDGKIPSEEYFRRVREETGKTVRREIIPPPSTPKPKPA